MKRLKTIGFVLLILLAGLAVWKFWLQDKKEITAAQTEKPQHGTISLKITATGTVEPVDTVAVGTQISGTIKNVYADFNSVVKKGQLLAELDRSLLEASVNQAAANVAQAQSQAVYQKSNFDRQSQLYNIGAISKADYDAAFNQYTVANASVKSAQAQLQSTQKNLSYARIYSPIDGVVLSRNISVGQTVAASFSTPTLFSIAKDITKMQVQAKVDEADIGNVKQGQRASFKVDAYPNEEFEGTVDEIRVSPSVSSNVVTYTTLVSAANEAQKLLPGMTATITIITKEEKNALLIPAKALKFSPDSNLGKQYAIVSYKGPDAGPSSFAWIKQGNELVQKKIRTGLNDNTQVQVLDGIGPADEVVTGTIAAKQVESTSSNEQASPFMPKRPNRNNNKKMANAGPPPQ